MKQTLCWPFLQRSKSTNPSTMQTGNDCFQAKAMFDLNSAKLRCVHLSRTPTSRNSFSRVNLLRHQALQITLEEWKRTNVSEAAHRALAYVPRGQSEMRLIVMQKTDSFSSRPRGKETTA